MLTFSLIVYLHLPMQSLQMYELGHGMTRDECLKMREYAIVQLEDTLSVAILDGVDCLPERRV